MHIFVAALLVGLDQLSKWWAIQAFADGGGLTLGLGFRLTFIRNTGAAFGLFRDLDLRLGALMIDGTVLLGILSLIVSLVLAWYLWRRSGSLSTPSRIALTLVLAGAAGNMIDRLLRGFVVDFIHFRVSGFDYPVFNLADSFVVVGGLLLVFGSFFERSRPAPNPGD